MFFQPATRWRKSFSAKMTSWKWIFIFKFIRRSPNSRACDRKKRRRSRWQCHRRVKYKFWKSQNCHRETRRKTSRNWVRIDRIVFFWIRTNEFNGNYRFWKKVKIFEIFFGKIGYCAREESLDSKDESGRSWKKIVQFKCINIERSFDPEDRSFSTKNIIIPQVRFTQDRPF